MGSHNASGSGFRRAMSELFLWALLAASGFGTMYYFEHIYLAADRVAGRLPAIIDSVTAKPQSTEQGFDSVVRLAADWSGHFAVSAYVNGRPLELMADTGATLIAIGYEDAERLGLNPAGLDFSVQTRTANGVSRVARVLLDRVEVGTIRLRDVEAVVAEPGKLSTNLLGMSFIGRLKSFEMRGRELVLVQ